MAKPNVCAVSDGEARAYCTVGLVLFDPIWHEQALFFMHISFSLVKAGLYTKVGGGLNRKFSDSFGPYQHVLGLTIRQGPS